MQAINVKYNGWNQPKKQKQMARYERKRKKREKETKRNANVWKCQKVSKASKSDGRGARLGVSMNHKVKLHGVRKYTQDQPGVEDGKQKHHTGLPGAIKKAGKMQKKQKQKKQKQKTRNDREGYQKAKYSRKAQHPACPLACPVLIP